MFKRIDEIICRNNIFTIYLLTSKNTILHLTFSEERHHSALDLLDQTGAHQITTGMVGKNNEICGILKEYLSGKSTELKLMTDPYFIEAGTPFQRQVWELIRQIPYGETRTYGDLARRSGGIKLSRAVGHACHANPLALVIPCHRVVGLSGTGGFAGGGEIKKRLIAIEKDHLSLCR